MVQRRGSASGHRLSTSLRPRRGAHAAGDHGRRRGARGCGQRRRPGPLSGAERPGSRAAFGQLRQPALSESRRRPLRCRAGRRWRWRSGLWDGRRGRRLRQRWRRGPLRHQLRPERAAAQRRPRSIRGRDGARRGGRRRLGHRGGFSGPRPRRPSGPVRGELPQLVAGHRAGLLRERLLSHLLRPHRVRRASHGSPVPQQWRRHLHRHHLRRRLERRVRQRAGRGGRGLQRRRPARRIRRQRHHGQPAVAEPA